MIIKFNVEFKMTVNEVCLHYGSLGNVPGESEHLCQLFYFDFAK